jgi:hypothetical protein
LITPYTAHGEKSGQLQLNKLNNVKKHNKYSTMKLPLFVFILINTAIESDKLFIDTKYPIKFLLAMNKT